MRESASRHLSIGDDAVRQVWHVTTRVKVPVPDIRGAEGKSQNNFERGKSIDK